MDPLPLKNHHTIHPVRYIEILRMKKVRRPLFKTAYAGMKKGGARENCFSPPYSSPSHREKAMQIVARLSVFMENAFFVPFFVIFLKESIMGVNGIFPIFRQLRIILEFGEIDSDRNPSKTGRVNGRKFNRCQNINAELL
jgi:hypothetical protein